MLSYSMKICHVMMNSQLGVLNGYKKLKAESACTPWLLGMMLEASLAVTPKPTCDPAFPFITLPSMSNIESK